MLMHNGYSGCSVIMHQHCPWWRPGSTEALVQVKSPLKYLFPITMSYSKCLFMHLLENSLKHLAIIFEEFAKIYVRPYSLTWELQFLLNSNPKMLISISIYRYRYHMLVISTKIQLFSLSCASFYVKSVPLYKAKPPQTDKMICCCTSCCQYF